MVMIDTQAKYQGERSAEKLEWKRWTDMTDHITLSTKAVNKHATDFSKYCLGN